MNNKIKKYFKYKVHTYIAMAYDLIVSIIAFHLSWKLRYESYSPDNYLIILLIAAFTQSFMFYMLGLYRGIWRFSSIPDLLRVIKGATLGIAFSMATIFLYSRLNDIPRTIFLIDWFVLIVLLGSGRFSYRLWKDNRTFSTNGKRTIIIGAGEAGDQLIREIINNKKMNLHIVGFIDDDLRKSGKTLRGIPILGTTTNLKSITELKNVEKIILAIPSANKTQIKKIFDLCTETGIDLQTLPSLSQILNGKIELSLLRKIKPEDLLGREAVILDSTQIGRIVTDEVVLITGAAGSIGSELTKQIANFNPKILLLLDISELFIYNLENDLKEKFPQLNFITFIRDIKNKESLKEIFSQYRPSIVYHAAAYKHVPLMEKNPLEAITNNIGGTNNICELCMELSVPRMVLVSTDKAVNPTNIMGTTKRIAEMVCQFHQQNSKTTKFMIVRFGNVLGSNGSVIPRFKDQIEKGGPITVTHPEITRFFMSIPESCQLILQASSMGNGGEIFILEMGEPIKIIELAEQMIRMAGLKPHEDIKITFVGLRPGEKLYEELLATSENTLPTHHPKVKVALARKIPKDIDQWLEKVLQIKQPTNRTELDLVLQELVPEFQTSHSH